MIIINSNFLSNIWEGDANDLYLNSGKTSLSNVAISLSPGPSSIYIVGGDFSCASWIMNTINGVNPK